MVAQTEQADDEIDRVFQALAAATPGLSAGAEPHAAAMALVLEVSVNGAPRGLHPFRAQGGALWVEASTLRTLGFKPEDVRAIVFSQLRSSVRRQA